MTATPRQPHHMAMAIGLNGDLFTNPTVQLGFCYAAHMKKHKQDQSDDSKGASMGRTATLAGIGGTWYNLDSSTSNSHNRKTLESDRAVSDSRDLIGETPIGHISQLEKDHGGSREQKHR